MSIRIAFLATKTALVAGTLLAGVAGAQAPQLPDAAGRETVRRVCASCHPAEIVMGQGLSREQWGNLVSNMVGRGAKGSDEDFTEIVNYLATNLPPRKTGANETVSATARAATTGTPPSKAAQKRPPSLIDQAGPSDKQVVDEEAATRGKATYLAQCITCHGPRGRGNEQGPDLVRSLVVLKDRYGSTLGPYLLKGHPMQSGQPSSSLTQAQIEDLSHFVHQQVNDTLRTGPKNTILNVLTGDPKAGEAYFNGAGKCNSCHSPTGNLAGIASKYDPPALQLKTVFPQSVAFGKRASVGLVKKPVTVTVTTASGQQVTGVLNKMDDFDVSLTDDKGEYRSFTRSAGVTVVKHDPFAAHEALLDQYTDKDIHDVVAYLETLK